MKEGVQVSTITVESRIYENTMVDFGKLLDSCPNQHIKEMLVKANESWIELLETETEFTNDEKKDIAYRFCIFLLSKEKNGKIPLRNKDELFWGELQKTDFIKLLRKYRPKNGGFGKRYFTIVMGVLRGDYEDVNDYHMKR